MFCLSITLIVEREVNAYPLYQDGDNFIQLYKKEYVNTFNMQSIAN